MLDKNLIGYGAKVSFRDEGNSVVDGIVYDFDFDKRPNTIEVTVKDPKSYGVYVADLVPISSILSYEYEEGPAEEWIYWYIDDEEPEELEEAIKYWEDTIRYTLSNLDKDEIDLGVAGVAEKILEFLADFYKNDN